jgi:hypothetical protein
MESINHPVRGVCISSPKPRRGTWDTEFSGEPEDMDSAVLLAAVEAQSLKLGAGAEGHTKSWHRYSGMIDWSARVGFPPVFTIFVSYKIDSVDAWEDFAGSEQWLSAMKVHMPCPSLNHVKYLRVVSTIPMLA